MKLLVIILNNLTMFIEAIVAVLGVLLAIRRKKKYGWLVAAAFFVYVVYNFIAIYNPIHVSESLFALALSIGSVLILSAFWMIYKEK